MKHFSFLIKDYGFKFDKIALGDLIDEVITRRMMLDLVIEHFSINSPVNKVDFSQIGLNVERCLSIYEVDGQEFVINTE